MFKTILLSKTVALFDNVPLGKCKIFYLDISNLSFGFKQILSVDLFTFSTNLTMFILLFNDKIALIQIYQNIFTTFIHITICELIIYHLD